jgi:hypothetical protein
VKSPVIVHRPFNAPLLVIGLLIASLLSACAGLFPDNPEPLPTLTPTITETPTVTILWFPPTDTPRPVLTPTPVPTRNDKPGIGKETFSDTFTTDSQWDLAQTGGGSMAYSINELTLALSQPKGSLSSLNHALLLSDFYLEIDVKPSLCRGDDQYGLLLRAATTLDNYRLLVTCNGLLRLERLNHGKTVVLHDWTPSGQVRPGAPAVVRIGAWALRNEMRIFINDVYQFSTSDKIYPTGGLGVFTRSAGNTSLTVNFSNLHIYSLDPNRVPPTETPTSTPAKTRRVP